MVKGFAARFGGFEGNGELLLGFLLADEFAEARGAELQLEGLVVVDARGGDEPVGVGDYFRLDFRGFHSGRWYGEEMRKSNRGFEYLNHSCD